MAEILLMKTDSNSQEQSVVPVVVGGLTCALKKKLNEFGDDLPIIPSESRVDSEGRVLYRLLLVATIKDRFSGTPVSGRVPRLKTNRNSDKLTFSGLTDGAGEILIALESREKGALTISPASADILLDPFNIDLKDAWYQSKFLITGYNVCAEDDFSGELVDADGLDEKHKKDFLFSALGVPMQGTGKTSQGKYIRLKSMTCGWHKNSKGRPDYVSDQECVSFEYANRIQGAYGVVSAQNSIAVDRRVIPKLVKVEIEGVGKRSADDKGSAISGYHIDNFLGSGKSVVTAWLQGGVNGTNRKVKYLAE